MKTLKGKITLLFDRDYGLSIELEDALSHTTIRVKVDPDKVCTLLSRQACMPCEVSWPETDKIGMDRQTSRVALEKTWEDYKPSGEVIAQACIDQGYIKDGWQLWSNGLSTQQRVRGVHEVVLSRYVDPEQGD